MTIYSILSQEYSKQQLSQMKFRVMRKTNDAYEWVAVRLLSTIDDILKISCVDEDDLVLRIWYSRTL